MKLRYYLSLLLFLLFAQNLCEGWECRDLEREIDRAIDERNSTPLPRLYHQLGDCYRQNNKPQQAALAYKKALSFQSKVLNLSDRLSIIESLVKVGDNSSAHHALQKILFLNPDLTTYQLYRSIFNSSFLSSKEKSDFAIYLGNEGHDDIAIYELRQIIQEEPNALEARLWVARFLTWRGEAGDQEEAESFINPVFAKEPKSILGRLIKGNILNFTHRPNEAITLFEQLIQNETLNQEELFEAKSGLVRAYINLKDFKKAENLLSQLAPKLAYQENLVKNLKLAFNQEKEKEVKPSKEPKKEERIEKKAEEKVDSEKIERECDSYLKEIEEKKWSANSYEMGQLYRKLGDCYALSQKVDLAIPAYQKALQLNNLPIKEQVKLALYFGNNGKDSLAIEALKRIIHEAPDNLEALIWVARFLTWRGQEGDQKEAEPFICRALTIEPDNKTALLTYGNILNFTERSLEALSLFNCLLARKEALNWEEGFEARVGLVRAYANLGEFTASEKQLCVLVPDQEYQKKVIKNLHVHLKNKIKEFHQKWIQSHLDHAAIFNERRCFPAAYWEIYQALKCDPCNLSARIALATTLGLDGQYCEALSLLNCVLKQEPFNVEAWITKGMILRWKQNIPGSTAVYLNALYFDCQNFHALLGLAYTDLERDERVGAYHLIAHLHPKNELQEIDRCQVLQLAALGPIVAFNYFQFRDSDHIRTDDYLVNIAKYHDAYRFDLFYRHVDATQPVDESRGIAIKERADIVQFEALRHINACHDVGGGVGFVDTSQSQFFTARARANIRTACGNFALGSLYDPFTLTAAAIFFEIRTWKNYISYVNQLTGRWGVGGEYAYTKYSDGNHAHRVELFTKYKLLDCCAKLFFDYRIIYWDFESQIITPFVVPGVFGGHGYFNPQNYFENLFGLTLAVDTRRVILVLRPSISYLTYNQSGLHNGIYYYALGNFTYKFHEKFHAGFGLEIGYYPLKNLNYHYTIVYGRALYKF